MSNAEFRIKPPKERRFVPANLRNANHLKLRLRMRPVENPPAWMASERLELAEDWFSPKNPKFGFFVLLTEQFDPSAHYSVTLSTRRTGQQLSLGIGPKLIEAFIRGLNREFLGRHGHLEADQFRIIAVPERGFLNRLHYHAILGVPLRVRDRYETLLAEERDLRVRIDRVWKRVLTGGSSDASLLWTRADHTHWASYALKNASRQSLQNIVLAGPTHLQVKSPLPWPGSLKRHAVPSVVTWDLAEAMRPKAAWIREYIPKILYRNLGTRVPKTRDTGVDSARIKPS